ncbi:hypothetical protein BDV95DRAFT_612781 [Massariosphaeria phaeospora]|uniref:Uncharacterized protein n=1 Tax=Massariosphaeria phaeospora TaxID=100035 RepID=A0A7C8HYS0_9PLEO|nr:hypothetical protein BDV95DRAFT_612781 [Massariosphaeria phaeospora]
MEVIAGVASAFAVVSLSLQLLDKIHSFCEFWEKVQGAPKDISDLVQELRLLEAVIREIYEKEKQYGPDPTLTSVLQSVSTQVEALLATMAKYQAGASSNGRVLRTWSSFKLSLRGNQMMQFRLSLSETKTTLVLARFNLHEKVQYRLHEQAMTALTEGFTNLNVQKVSGTVSNELNEPLDIQNHLASLKSQMRLVTTGVPQSWIQSGMQIAIDKAVQGLADKLSVEFADAKKKETSPETQRGRTTRIAQGYSSPAADIESAKDPTRPESDSRHRRARYLGPNHFHGSYASITPSIFGTIYLNTNRFYVHDPTITEDGDRNSTETASEIETQFTFYPASWLMWWGLRYGFHVVLYREGASWKNSLQTFHAVPDDSLIFEFCEQGNIMAVNSLLTRGRASPWDTNSKGWTPLHLASWRCDVALMKTLLRAGSNREALTFDFPNGNYEHCSPLVTAATINSATATQIPPQQRIEALRLLLDNLEFSNHESQAWKMVLVVLERERASTGLCTTTEVSEWILDTFLGDLRESCSPPIVAWLLTFCLESPTLLRRVLDISGDLVDASFVPGGYTPMHSKIAENFSDAVVPGIKILLQKGANPHHVGMTSSAYGGDDAQRLDTPTSLAMRRSSSFFRWRQIVREAGYDIDQFVADELSECLLVTSAWTVSSLRQLFELDFEPLELAPDLCTQCGRVVYHTFDHDEVWWETLLDQLKGNAKGTPVYDALETSEGHCGQTDEMQECSSPVSSGSTSSTESSEDDDLCWKCAIMRRTYGTKYERGRL